MKRKLFLFAWLFAMVFPLNWLRQEVGFIRRRFDPLFAAEWIHVVAHLVLFAGLVLLLWFVFNFPFNSRTAFMIGGLILLVGVIQEILQLQVKGRGFGWPEVFDLNVDLNGAALGYLIAWGLSNWRAGAAQGITSR